MHIKFRIVFEDGTQVESHDEMYNRLYDHSHFLPPNQSKQWKQYWLISDEGHELGVDFHGGQFFIRKNRDEEMKTIQVQDGDGNILTDRTEKQEFEGVSEPWRINNGLEYFPVVGRRITKADWGERITYFCGWKIKYGKKRPKDKYSPTLQVLYHMLENGQIVPEIS